MVWDPPLFCVSHLFFHSHIAQHSSHYFISSFVLPFTDSTTHHSSKQLPMPNITKHSVVGCDSYSRRALTLTHGKENMKACSQFQFHLGKRELFSKLMDFMVFLGLGHGLLGIIESQVWAKRHFAYFWEIHRFLFWAAVP
jgi:hypothetical protein